MRKNICIKLLALVMTLAMCFCFAACGGSGDSGDAANDGGGSELLSDELGGCGDVVFNLPEGYECEQADSGYFIAGKEGTPIMAEMSRTTQENIDEWVEMGDSDVKTLDEYFEQYSDPDYWKGNKDCKYTWEDNKICGTDGVLFETVARDETIELGCMFKFKDAVYGIYMYNPDAWDDDGNLAEDIQGITDDERAIYDAMMASTKEGKYEAGPARLGDLEFTTPEGFEQSSWDDGCEFKNDKLSITVNNYDLKELCENYEEDFDSFDAYMDKIKEWAGEDSETYEVCGSDCLIEKLRGDSTVYYSADVVVNDSAYEFMVDAIDAYDKDGNENPDCYKLTDDDYAAFKAFLDGIKLAE